MGVKKFNLQITFMYIHFSHYANQPKYTAEIRKTLNVFCIYFLGQWFVKTKLKKLFILTCEFVSNFAARYWYKMVVTPCSRHGHKHLQFLPDLHHKMWWKEYLFHIDQALIGSSKFGHVGVFVHYVHNINITFNKSPNTIAWWLAMSSCKEYPFSIDIEILLMMTQINKVFATLILFSTAAREIEDLNHNWKVFFKVINKDCLYFINKIFIVVVIISDETKGIVLNISITVNKIYNKRV